MDGYGTTGPRNQQKCRQHSTNEGRMSLIFNAKAKTGRRNYMYLMNTEWVCRSTHTCNGYQTVVFCGILLHCSINQQSKANLFFPCRRQFHIQNQANLKILVVLFAHITVFDFSRLSHAVHSFTSTTQL